MAVLNLVERRHDRPHHFTDNGQASSGRKRSRIQEREQQP
jgi:hypothetical protein